MKKTGTKIFSLALAIILVSTLSSGVIYASDGRVRDVALLECIGGPGFMGTFTAFDGPADITELPVTDMSCPAQLAFLLNKRFKIAGIGAFVTPFGAVIERYTMVRTGGVRRNNDHGGEE